MPNTIPNNSINNSAKVPPSPLSPPPSPSNLGRQFPQERRFYDPRSWGVRLISLVQRIRRRLRGTHATDTLKAAMAKRAESGVDTREIKHFTGPERAMQVLARQKQRDCPDQPMPKLDAYADQPEVVADIGTTPVQQLGEGNFGQVTSVMPRIAGPIHVRKTFSWAGMMKDPLASQKEPAILKGLDHPNIIKIRPIKQSAFQMPRMDMEYGGASLADYIRGVRNRGRDGSKPYEIDGGRRSMIETYNYQPEVSDEELPQGQFAKGQENSPPLRWDTDHARHNQVHETDVQRPGLFARAKYRPPGY